MIDPAGEIPAVRWTVWDMVVGVALAMAASALFGALLLIGRNGSLEPLVFPTAIALSGGALLWVVWWLTVRRYSISWSSLGLQWPELGRIYWIAPATLLGSLAFTGIYTAIVTKLGYEVLMPEPLPAELFGHGVAGAVSAALAVVWVPFAEEVFFRGFLFAGLSARYGVVTGAVGSSMLFALAHLSLATVLPIFVTGMLFAWAYHRTRSTWIPVSAHVAQNLLAVSTIGLA